MCVAHKITNLTKIVNAKFIFNKILEIMNVCSSCLRRPEVRNIGLLKIIKIKPPYMCLNP